MEIRDLQRQEAEAAVALWEACGLTRPWNDPHADLSPALGGASSTVLAAWEDARLGAPEVQLMVRKANAEALGFYEALGYTDQGTVTLGRFLDPELEERRRVGMGG